MVGELCFRACHKGLSQDERLGGKRKCRCMEQVLKSFTDLAYTSKVMGGRIHGWCYCRDR